MAFDDLFSEDEFLIDAEDLEVPTDENWDTGITPDIFVSGEEADIFSTKSLISEEPDIFIS